jgi:membrane protease YdiL (CAAX protease family)
VLGDIASLLQEILYYFIHYLPGYVGLVLVPAVIRVLIERALGIKIEPVSSIHDYEAGFRSVVLHVLYYPFFEEVFFRGIPLLLFGMPGLVVGSIVWALLHPVSQLQLVRNNPVSKKILFTITTSFYYLCCAVFYSMVWLGSGVVAFLYHSMHNGLVVLTEYLREIPPPWYKPRYITPQPVLPRIRTSKASPVARSTSPAGSEEAPLTFIFVKPKSSLKSLREEEEGLEFLFIKRKR